MVLDVLNFYNYGYIVEVIELLVDELVIVKYFVMGCYEYENLMVMFDGKMVYFF